MAIMQRHLTRPLPLIIGLVLATACGAAVVRTPAPEIAAINDAMRAAVSKPEIAGAVTMVVAPDHILHLGAVGQADIASAKPMTTDALFWIASMTKPITGTAVLMLQDEGKLSVDDPVAKYVPELANVKTADGTPGNLTLRHLMTHTSGLAESTQVEQDAAKSLKDLVPGFAGRPLQFKPGSKWQYCQTGMNTLGRIVEIVSGQSFPDFLHSRLFTPLGMVDTTFYPSAAQIPRIATSYKLDQGALVASKVPRDFDPANVGHYPGAHGGLYATASDYARFCQMLLNDGSLDGKRYLKPESVTLMRTVSTGELKTGFTDGNGWGLTACVVRQPQGVSAALSPGSFGHGGMYGTQAWIDPVTKRAYILLVQRQGFANSDNSDVRKAFQDAAAGALK
jgi:CubicO group peptidase (beta-lactamase class C family)